MYEMIAGNQAGKEAVSLTKGEKNPVSPGAEQRVAAFFAARGAGILQMPLSEIASACGVSDAAVVRHCRREGYRGLKDYKIAKANERQADLSAPPVRGDEPLPELKRRIFSGCIRAMKETSDQLNTAELERAIRTALQEADLPAEEIEFVNEFRMLMGHDPKIIMRQIGEVAKAPQRGML